MKRAKKVVADDEMRPEYDFSGGVRGKYFRRYQEGTNIVVLAPDVAEVFPNAEAVNEALRPAKVARKKARPRRKSASRGRRRQSMPLQLTSSGRG